MENPIPAIEADAKAALTEVESKLNVVAVLVAAKAHVTVALGAAFILGAFVGHAI